MPGLNWKDPKVKAGAGIAGVVVAYALYKAHQNSTAATSSTAGTTADPTGAASALGDASAQDAVYGSLEDQLQSLNSIVSGLQNTAPVASSPGSSIPIDTTPSGPGSIIVTDGGNPPQNTSLPPGTSPGGLYKLPAFDPSRLKLKGEKIVGQVIDAAGNGGYYLSNYGGVYAVGAAPFLGSAPLISKGQVPVNLFDKIVSLANGGYAITNTQNQTVTFSPSAPGHPTVNHAAVPVAQPATAIKAVGSAALVNNPAKVK